MPPLVKVTIPTFSLMWCENVVCATVSDAGGCCAGSMPPEETSTAHTPSSASSAEHGIPGASGAGVSAPDSSAASADSGGSGGSAGSASSVSPVSPVSSADSAASSPVMSTAAPSTAAPEHSAGESPSDDYAPTDIGGVKSGDSGMALPEGEVFADTEMAAADGFAD